MFGTIRKPLTRQCAQWKFNTIMTYKADDIEFESGIFFKYRNYRNKPNDENEVQVESL